MKAYGGTNPVEFAILREGDPDQRMETLGTWWTPVKAAFSTGSPS
ncbi:hypothetical protein SAMN04490197_2636 [Pseudomonas orientalis]|uniref:Uncharacterized protein n=1 Tax=Pseudomonas orientalis TaxID=76758 RepID=A0A8B3XXZ9_9PSED|nr:hypothetical protein SAMN04490197_2636 [Pseudomonas orientalis]